MSKSKIILLLIITLSLIIGFIYINSIRDWNWSSVVSATSFKTVPTKHYSIDAPGINPRVYEFNTTDGKHCVVLFRSSSKTAPTMQCYDVVKSTGVK